MSENFKSLDELISTYISCIHNNHDDGLPPYATFKTYLVENDDCEDCIDRPSKIKDLVDNLNNNDDNKKLDAILKLWSHGGEIYITEEGTARNHTKLIHSVSNTTRLQVFLKDGKKEDTKGVVVNKDKLLKFAAEIGTYIRSFDGENDVLNDKTIEHKLVEKANFKELIANNIDSVINELLFWYYYYEDKYPIINSRAKNSRKILNKAFPKTKKTKDLEFNTACMDASNFSAIKKEGGEKIYISKQLMLDQLFYSIDEMKSMKKVDETYSSDEEKDEEIYKFYRKLWNTIKEHKNVVNNEDFFNKLLTKSKNIILYGAPGTGKTYTTETNIENIIKENPNPTIDDKRFKKVQFHPSYSYEDFMEGLKPVIENNNVVLKLQEGDFMKFCREASACEEAYKVASDNEKMKYAFFFLVDEINRAELSRVFGEIMYALDKRGNTISTQYTYMKEEGSEAFKIPENLYFIGTMNDVDRSIDSFDIALRRRFFWYRMDCEYSVIFNELESIYNNIGEFGKKDIPDSGYLKACYDLNQFITTKGDNRLGLGKLYELGHSYFLNIQVHTKKNDEKIAIENKDLKSLFDFSIEPLLREYLRAEYAEEDIEQHLKKAKEIFKLPTQNQ